LSRINKQKALSTFDEKLADHVLELISTGHTVESISKLVGMPKAYIIRKWCYTNTEFGEKMKEARRMRADHYAEKAIDTAESTRTKRDVLVNKLKVSTYQWMAERLNPEAWGNKPKEQGPSSVTIVLNTGINREPIDITNDTIEILENNGERKDSN
jgi:hypothetical protein